MWPCRSIAQASLPMRAVPSNKLVEGLPRDSEVTAGLGDVLRRLRSVTNKSYPPGCLPLLLRIAHFASLPLRLWRRLKWRSVTYELGFYKYVPWVPLAAAGDNGGFKGYVVGAVANVDWENFQLAGALSLQGRASFCGANPIVVAGVRLLPMVIMRI